MAQVNGVVYGSAQETGNEDRGQSVIVASPKLLVLPCRKGTNHQAVMCALH